jgi:hypothetical protein
MTIEDHLRGLPLAGQVEALRSHLLHAERERDEAIKERDFERSRAADLLEQLRDAAADRDEGRDSIARLIAGSAALLGQREEARAAAREIAAQVCLVAGERTAAKIQARLCEQHSWWEESDARDE